VLEEDDTADVATYYFPIQMSSKKTLMLVLAWIAGLGSVAAFLAMLTQAMLTGTSPEAVWRSRVYLWWVDFLLAGWLLLASVYLVRKSRRLEQAEISQPSKSVQRVVLFPLGHLLLTACLYFADYAWYVRNYR
jgi:hypothetical protein